MTNWNAYTPTPFPSATTSLQQRSGATPPGKLASTAKEFESVLLTQWLQAAESSFGSAPGGDDDADSGGEQMKNFGVQQLATALSNAGGIGIAKMVSRALSNQTQSQHPQPTKPQRRQDDAGAITLRP